MVPVAFHFALTTKNKEESRRNRRGVMYVIMVECFDSFDLFLLQHESYEQVRR